MVQAAQIVNEISKVIVGKDIIIKKVLMVMLAKGHILLEDIPGVGKTTLAIAFAKTMRLQTRRIQFTPDVMPSDVVGFTMYDKGSDSFRYQQGAVFCHILLADEINRASAKAQSALLEVMEEGRVSVDGNTYELPDPFIVIATQNPLGSAGTQLLPESQLDRFMVRLSIGYPSMEQEAVMMKMRHHHDPLLHINALGDEASLHQMMEGAAATYVSDEMYQYIAALIHATREHPQIRQGASPRASLALCALGKSCAYLSGRDYMIPQDIKAVFFDTIAHRLLLKRESHPSYASLHTIIDSILQSVEAPQLRK